MKRDDKIVWLVTGDRIGLRNIKESDVEGNYYRWMNDPEVTIFLENSVQRYSVESLQGYVKEIKNDRAYIFQAIIDRGCNQHIGNLKLGPINWVHRFGDLGIVIGVKEKWGKGYATEAISMIIKHAFNDLNLHKVTAGCNERNLGALKAFQKNGFEIEGLRKRQFLWKGDYVDGILLGLVNDKYQIE